MQVIDESMILVHNGQQHRFQQGTNEFFQNTTISETKKMFDVGISDTNQMDPCRSSTIEDMEIPLTYDFREAYPQCVKPVRTGSRDCSSQYVLASLSAVEDHICKDIGRPITLSDQEVIDCDKASFGCEGGMSNKVFNFGKRKGFVEESCYPSTGKLGECPEDHFSENSCRVQQQVYKAVDFCLTQQTDNIKKEILTNGPVVAQMTPYTDFLTYKEGVYHRTGDGFKFNGNHVVKILGWDQSPDGSGYWIVENAWGPEWGEDGFGKVASGGETMLDYYAIGFATYPYSMATFYAQQEAQQQQQMQTEWIQDGEEMNLDDLDFSVVTEEMDTEL